MIDVDKAFCFSLKSAEERRQLLIPEWEKIGLDVEYILNDKSSEP